MATNVSFFVREEVKSEGIQPTLEFEEFYDGTLAIHAYYDKADEYNYVVVNVPIEDLQKLAEYLNTQVEKNLEK